MTDLPEIRLATASLMPWMVLSPLISVWAFTYDGIFIGGTWTRSMRNSVAAAAVTFCVAVWALQGPFGQHGLWAAFLMFFAVRGIWLAVALRGEGGCSGGLSDFRPLRPAPNPKDRSIGGLAETISKSRPSLQRAGAPWSF